MAVVTVKVQDSEITRAYFDSVAEKLGSPDFYKNPFTGHAKSFWRKKELLAVVDIEPVYPQVWLASIIFAVTYVIAGWWWLLIPAAFFLSLGALWSGAFYRLMIWRGLRRKGYDGPVKQLSASSAWRWLVGTD